MSVRHGTTSRYAAKILVARDTNGGGAVPVVLESGALYEYIPEVGALNRGVRP